MREPEHPAMGDVYWTGVPGQMCEVAEYRGHKLRVRHAMTKPDKTGEDRLQIGFIDDKLCCSVRGHMARICNLLYARVDRIEGDSIALRKKI